MSPENASLSNTELAILAGVAEGKTNGEVAHDLSLAPDTIKKYLGEIYGKLGARRRSHAVAIAYRRGLIG